MTDPRKPNPKGFPCPKCGEAVSPFEIDLVTTVDFCQNCKVMWFKAGGIGKICGYPKDLPDLVFSLSQSRDSGLKCPVCIPEKDLKVMKFSPMSELEIDYCAECEGILLDAGEYAAIQKTRKKSPTPSIEDIHEDNFRLPYDDHWVNLLAVPCAFAMSALIESFFPIIRFYLYGALLMPIHELGHAMTAWLCSRAAVPLPFVTLRLSYTRSVWIYVITNLILLFLANYSHHQKLRFPLLISQGFMFLSFWFTWVLSPTQQNMAITYGGEGGTWILGTLLACAFFHQVPVRQWALIRPVLLFCGAYGMVQRFFFFQEIRSGKRELPEIAAYGLDSDFKVLNETYGWSLSEITDHFLKLGTICFCFVFLYSIFQWIRTRRVD
jgi:Zn-finger nucleic acid-binding protein